MARLLMETGEHARPEIQIKNMETERHEKSTRFDVFRYLNLAFILNW